MYCRSASFNEGEEEPECDEFCHAERRGVEQKVGRSAERARDGKRAEMAEICVCPRDVKLW